MADRVRIREVDDAEGRRLLRIIRRGTGSAVAWRLARMVLLSAQGMPVAKITEVTFTSPDRVRDLTQNFSTALAAEGCSTRCGSPLSVTTTPRS